jgi:hypothetical protein
VSGDADGGPTSSQQQPQKKLSKLEQLMQKDLQAKQRQAAAAAAPPAAGSGPSSSGRGAVNGSKGRVDHWLYEGIVVKVLSKALKEQGYYKQKVRAVGGLRGGMGGKMGCFLVTVVHVGAEMTWAWLHASRHGLT